MKRRNEVMVGLMITATVVVLIMGTLYLARGGLSAGYPLYSRFTWGQNLKQGQPVLLAGASVGYVDEVKFNQYGWLDVTYRINKEYQVPEGTTATVEPNGIFGDKLIALHPPLLAPGRPASSNFHSAGDTIPAGKPATTVDQLLARLDTVSSNVQNVSEAIELEMVGRGGITDVRRTLAQTSALVTQLSGIASEQSRQLSLTLQSFRRSAGALDSARLAATVANIQQTSANAAQLTANLQRTTTELSATVAKLNNGEGTAGKLLTDTLLYRDVRNLVGRLDSLTADFKRNPRRYINLEIF
jgi:phospholipid/cholesterol/gamma-HCH transport system substrate-binding protein